MCQYDGPIGSANTVQDGWTDAFYKTWFDKRWEPGEKRKIKVKIPSRSLPKSGTYIVRFHLSEFKPQGALYATTKKALTEQPDIPQANKDAALAFIEQQWKDMGVDPYHPQQGSYTGERVFTGTIHDYFRVESFGIFISFITAVGTILLVFATLILAIIPLFKSSN